LKELFDQSSLFDQDLKDATEGADNELLSKIKELA